MLRKHRQVTEHKARKLIEDHKGKLTKEEFKQLIELLNVDGFDEQVLSTR